MRIIAGTARSLPLRTISGMETRPTSDRIKETLFNMLSPYLCGCHFLDLFAGSGQIGLEAVSRGAARAVFVENSKKAAACIEENITFTKFTEQCRLFVRDAVSAIRQMEGQETFDLVFMDPPYGKGLELKALRALSDSTLLRKNCLVVAEAALGTDFSVVKDWGYQITKEKTYKNNQHIFLNYTREAI